MNHTDDGPLRIDVGEHGELIVRGDLDMATGPALEAAILERESGQPTVIDLHGVDFIDSSGLRTLLSASMRARDRGTAIVLRQVGPEVVRLLEITGTATQFAIESKR